MPWKSLLLLIILALTTYYVDEVRAAPMSKAPTYMKIAKGMKKLKPDLDDKVAAKYAKIIEKYCNKYKLDWRIPVSIFRKESGFKLSAVNYGSKDFGLGQINYRNIIKKKLNLGKILTDPDYGIRTAIEHLIGSRGYAKREKTWYTRYYSYTPKLRRHYFNGTKRIIGLKVFLAKLGRKDVEKRTYRSTRKRINKKATTKGRAKNRNSKSLGYSSKNRNSKNSKVQSSRRDS